MTHFTKTIKALTTVSVIALYSSLGPDLAHAQSPFEWGAETSAAYDLNSAKAHGQFQGEIQIKYDSIHALPQLNINANTDSNSAPRAEATTFQTYWNYGAFIDRAEVRIFAADKSVQSAPLMRLPVKDGVAVLSANSSLPANVIYVLRVYDANGRFDQTHSKFLSITDSPHSGDRKAKSPQRHTGFGVDRTASRNINVDGGSVTIFGQGVSQSDTVTVLGRAAPVDSAGQFLAQHILPFGEHRVDVSVTENGQRTTIDRDIRLDGTDFFYLAIGDVTLGTHENGGPADFLASGDEDFNSTYLNGQGAFYMKGRLKGDYRVTGALDTGESRLKDIFRNLDEKDPRQLLRRIDSDRVYPVYGDDSTITEDAPTQGRFFLRVEKDDSHVMWGNFATQVTGTEFAHLDRGLYGAIADYNSQKTTSLGERATQVTAFAADPGTLPAREDYRGTGGSVYFLQRQDLSIGSERLRVEIRDKVSGLVLETRNLRPQDDYDIDYIQGRILLSDPLQSTVRDTQRVRSGALSGHEAFLVVRYEYTPTLSSIGGYTIGGRATQWVGDALRIGATAQTETTGDADQELIGVDALLRRSAGTYLKAEIAQTKGPAFGRVNSADGGFTFAEEAASGNTNLTVNAYRIEGAVDLAETSNLTGTLSAYYDHQDTGFSGTSQFGSGETDRFGARAAVNVTKFTKIQAQFDEIKSLLNGHTTAVYADASHEFSNGLTAAVGLRHDNREITAAAQQPAVDGSRTDLSVQLDHALSSESTVFGFAQATLDHDESRNRNNRYGVGGTFALNDRLSVTGEISTGDGGFGANAQASFKRSDTSDYYLGYSRPANQSDIGLTAPLQSLSQLGTLTFGAKTRFSDSLSVYGEERIGFGSAQSSLTHAYGLTFNPSEIWSFGASLENGQINDRINGAFDRTAVSLTAGRATQGLRMASTLEARFEDGNQAGQPIDRTTWLMRYSASLDAGKDWEVLGRFNFVTSDSQQSDFLNADFVEGVFGAAYRPVEHDRLNGLIKYTYFEDLSPAQQISSGGATNLARQKSQILSVDAIYDLTDKLSIGGKYGFRSGEVALSRTSDDFIKSDAHIAIARIDYHILKKWDILAEGRILSSDLTQDKKHGALLGIYRHLGDNAKIGAGYNVSTFSDDLRDFSTDNKGFFVNLVGKF